MSFSDRHYYIVNAANGNVLAPIISESGHDNYGANAGWEVFEYNQSTPEKKEQYKVYRQSFKWMIEDVGMGTGLTRFSNKWSGMYLGAVGREEGARLNQTKNGYFNWKLEPKEGSDAYIITNDETGNSIAVPSSEPPDADYAILTIAHRDEPTAAWLLVEANAFDMADALGEVPKFELEKDIRDNNWFKLATPDPHDAPKIGNTLAQRIDAIGKLTGMFPDQNEFEELYKKLVEAMEQIIKNAFMQDNLSDIMGQIGVARSELDTFDFDDPDPDYFWKKLEASKQKYDLPLNRLIPDDVKAAGFIIFIQAASEQLAVMHLMEAMKPGSTELAEVTQRYADHLTSTFKEMMADRLGLINFNQGLINQYVDTYERARIVTYIGDNPTFCYNYNRFKEMMTYHFDTEFGHPNSIAESWVTHTGQWLAALS